MSGIERVFADRYLLDVQINSTVGTSVWRALDKTLNRWVTVYLLEQTDSRRSNVINVCTSVAAKVDRDAIAILDVIDSGFIIDSTTGSQHGPLLAVITEWAEGTSLAERLGHDHEPLEAQQALAIASKLAVSLQRAHESGVAHGRLRPHNILLTAGTAIRISGYGIDRSFLGSDDLDLVRADIRGIGNLLFAMVTGSWPTESVDGLPAANGTGARVLPSSLRGGITHSIDALFLRTQDGSISTMRELLDVFSVGTVESSAESTSTLSRLAAQPVQWHGRPETHSHRIRATAIALIFVVGMGWVGWQLLTRNFNKSQVPTAIITALPAASLFPSPSSSPSDTVADIVSATDYDPFGDNTENPSQAALAIDNDPATSWNTVQYRDNSLAGKPGVGLLLDLGGPRPVTTVNLSFVAPGVSATVFVSDSAKPDITTASMLGSISQADTSAIIKSPRAISGRYVLVWITAVPQTSSGVFQGGITEITVRL